MIRTEVSKILKKYIDKPFALGDKNKGWDCLNILYDFYTSWGKNFPNQYKDFDENNYAEKWRSGKGKEELREFLFSLGEPVDPSYMRDGDLIIFEGKDMTFGAIYAGRGHVLVVFDSNIGVKIIELNLMKRMFTLISVRRL